MRRWRTPYERRGWDPSGLVEQRVLDTHESGWLLPSTPGGWFDDWQALRGAVGGTGRWPLALAVWGGGPNPDPFNRLEFGPAARTASASAAPPSLSLIHI